MAERRPVAGKVIGAYRDHDRARSAARRARDAAPGKARVRPPTRDDEIASLRSGMREEIRHTIVGSGNVGPFTVETSKGPARLVPQAAMAGALALLPFSAIQIGDWPLSFRIAIFASVGAVAGSVIGFLLGGGLGVAEKRPGEMAAERGALVVAEGKDAETVARAAAAMADEAIRVDVVTEDDVPVGDVTTEDERHQRRDPAERAAREGHEKEEVLQDRARGR